MWLPAVNHKEIHNDVPQLPDRHGEGRFLREGQTGSAREMSAMRKAIR
jgi:hypothetical protein